MAMRTHVCALATVWLICGNPSACLAQEQTESALLENLFASDEVQKPDAVPAVDATGNSEEPDEARARDSLPAATVAPSPSAVQQNQSPDGGNITAGSLREDLINPRLDAAIGDYNRTIDKAIGELSSDIDAEFNKATKRGDIETARKCRAAATMLRERGIPPEGNFLKNDRESAARSISRARAKIAAEFDAVAKECLKGGNLDQAEGILAEKAYLLADTKEWKAMQRGASKAPHQPAIVAAKIRDPQGLRLYKFTGDHEANLDEARKMLLWLGATITGSDAAGGWITGRLRPDLEITVWPKTYKKSLCYGIRYGDPQYGKAYFGSNDTYFEVCRGQ